MSFPKHLVLASQSPRRRELMTLAGFSFEVRSKNIVETYPESLSVYRVPEYLAAQKAKAFADDIDEKTVVIGADTVVVLDGKIFGKPRNENQAMQMLHTLSGRMHEVVSGVCIYSKHKEVCFSETTKVFFHELSNAEIAYYVEHYRPLDKAGSYGCQEWIGAVAIRRFEGDYFNVVGLPISRLYHELQQWERP